MAEYPNPQGFIASPGRGIHGRFESIYVQTHMTEKEVGALMTAPQRLSGTWMEELERHIRRSNSHIREVYEFEKRGEWGSGSEPPEARAFTAARLAEGASMLRDIWYTTWLKSGQEWLDEPVTYVGRNGRTLLEQMRELNEIDPRHHLEVARDGGVLRVVGIDNRKNGVDGRQWRCYLNNQPVKESIDRQPAKLNDRIAFRFEKLAR